MKIFDGEGKFSTGSNRNKAGRVVLIQTWRGNVFSWRVILLPWRGSVSAGSLLGGGVNLVQFTGSLSFEFLLGMIEFESIRGTQSESTIYLHSNDSRLGGLIKFFIA